MRSFVMQKSSSLSCLRRALHVSGILAALLAATMGPAQAGAADAAESEAGLWYDDTGDGAVRIEPCGKSLCGKIVWLKEPLHDDGTPLIDRHNPEASKQKRTICGMQILGDLKPSPEGGYDGGWVYDPKEGKSYSLAIKLSSKDQLYITGYLGVKFLGKSFAWTRAKTELPSCAPTQAAVPGAAAKAGTAAAGAGAAATTKSAATSNAGAATAAKPAATPAQPKKAGAGEALPWSGAKPAAPAAAAKPPAGSSQLGAAGLKPAAKKVQKPALTVTPPPLERALQ
jgi:uncharacterized protein (DUF2147 family)